MTPPSKPANGFVPQSIGEVLTYYNEYFVPIFAYATATSGQLPEQMLNELRNVLDHLSKANRGKSPNDNYLKAKNHIDRSCLDCAKIAWTILYQEAEDLYKSYTPKEYMLVDNGDFWHKVSDSFQKLRQASLTARRKEPDAINDDAGEAIDYYYQALNLAEILIETIENKAEILSAQIALYKKGVTRRDITLIVISAVVSATLGVCSTYIFLQTGIQ